MTTLQSVSTDFLALIRFLERDALALIAIVPANAVCLVHLAAELRKVVGQ
jgi:hypothetical protein